ncbi:DUF427-domain-containing protein [Gloeopeniophorella convolvens]|nr:DUF427-domain-containing protein [Gloeopeniophorella convolvens]
MSTKVQEFPYAGYSEHCAKRIRVLVRGDFIVDTTRAQLVWEHRYYPQYYFHKSDVRNGVLVAADASQPDEPDKYDIVLGQHHARAAATVHHSGPLEGLVKIEFDSVDAWFEEEEQIWVHPKDPYKRVDVLQSARHVRVEVDGVEVANTLKPRLLFETGLPVRTYIPKTDARLDLLIPSDLTSACPYKGVASYYDVKLPSGESREGLVWWYRNPTTECADIRGYVAFYDEKVDVFVNGVKMERPKTHF